MVCGFDKKVEAHHIIKRKDYGSDEEENLVYLCPNHHWIADFGEKDDREWIISEIKKITSKGGKEMEFNEKEILKKKARRLVEESLGRYSDEEWKERDMENSHNFTITVKWLRGIQCYGLISRSLNKRAEILLLIDSLSKKLEETRIYA